LLKATTKITKAKALFESFVVAFFVRDWPRAETWTVC